MMARLTHLMARFEEHWIADVLGAVSLFALLPAALWLGAVWGFK